MPKIVRIGLVGCGPRGIYIASLFNQHPHSRVTAVADIAEAAARKAAQTLEVPAKHIYTDFSAMLQSAPIDAIFVATALPVQVDLACSAMEGGLHVCTEVPAALTLEECHRLVRTVRRTGRKYQLMEQTRYSGFIEFWKRMHEAGEFGHICFAQGEYIHYERDWNYWIDAATGESINALEPPAGRSAIPSWRQKVLGEPIYYLPHTLGPLLYLLDDRVRCVSCMGTGPISYTYPDLQFPSRDIQYALMHTAKDTLLVVGAGFSLPYPRRHLQTGCHWYELRGTKASVESPRRWNDRFWRWRPDAKDHGDESALAAGDPTSHDWPPEMDQFDSPALEAASLHATEQEKQTGHGGRDFRPVTLFVDAILNDVDPAMGVFSAVETAAPAIVAAESARQGGTMLVVPDFRSEQ